MARSHRSASSARRSCHGHVPRRGLRRRTRLLGRVLTAPDGRFPLTAALRAEGLGSVLPPLTAGIRKAWQGARGPRTSTAFTSRVSGSRAPSQRPGPRPENQGQQRHGTDNPTASTRIGGTREGNKSSPRSTRRPQRASVPVPAAGQQRGRIRALANPRTGCRCRRRPADPESAKGMPRPSHDRPPARVKAKMVVTPRNRGSARRVPDGVAVAVGRVRRQALEDPRVDTMKSASEQEHDVGAKLITEFDNAVNQRHPLEITLLKTPGALLVDAAPLEPGATAFTRPGRCPRTRQRAASRTTEKARMPPWPGRPVDGSKQSGRARTGRGHYGASTSGKGHQQHDHERQTTGRPATEFLSRRRDHPAHRPAKVNREQRGRTLGSVPVGYPRICIAPSPDIRDDWSM